MPGMPPVFVTPGTGQQYGRTILYANEFESYITFKCTGNGTGWGVASLTAAKYFKQWGLAMITATEDPQPGDFVRIEHHVPYPQSGRVIFRTRISTYYYEYIYKIYFTLQFSANGNKHFAEVVYSPTGRYLYFVNDQGQSVEIEGHNYTVKNQDWSLFEMAIDVKVPQYIGVKFKGKETDLQGNNVKILSQTYGRFMYFWVTLTTKLAVRAKLYLDALYVGEFDFL